MVGEISVIKACPDPQTLRDFLLGRVQERDLEELAAHVEKCKDCQRKLEGDRASDLLLDAMRAPGAKELAKGPRLESMMDRFAQLKSRETISDLESQAGDSTPSPDNTVDEIRGCLAPPQERGEIGRLGPYRVLKLLGRGGMGAVFLAEDVQLGRKVALKIVLPRYAGSEAGRKRFLREAQAAAALDHDNIVTIYQVGEDRDVPFLAMQFLKGESLESWMSRGKHLSPPQILRLTRDIARGLAAAHAKGLVHRDIKPANLWLEAPKGRVKILDFGLALASRREDMRLTQTGVVVGTPAYLSPEQARGHVADARSDLFSLGCILYEMTTGQRPFKGHDVMSTLMALATENPASPRELNASIPQQISDLVMKLLSKDPAKRPQSAQELVKLTEEISKSLASSAVETQTSAIKLPIDSASPIVWTKAVPFLSRKRVVTAVALGLLGIALVALAGQVIIRIKGKDGKTTATIEVPPESTVTVESAGAIVPIKPPELAPPGTDRRAAERVLAVGGSVVIIEGTKDREIGAGGKLPPGEFRVRSINLAGNKQLVNADLASIQWLPKLEALNLEWTDIGDAGMAHLRELPVLQVLNLHGTSVTDASLKLLKSFPKLRSLALSSTKITDAGLKEVGALKLVDLGISGTSIGDAGLAHLKIPTLGGFSVTDTKITDAGVQHLSKNLPGLGNLNLTHTNTGDKSLEYLKELPQLGMLLTGSGATELGLAHVKSYPALTTLVLPEVVLTGAGLEHISKIPKLVNLSLPSVKLTESTFARLGTFRNLVQLDLQSTNIADKHLEHLKVLKKLQILILNGTQVTSAGMESLHQAIPQCRIQSDKGNIEPNLNPSAESTPSTPSGASPLDQLDPSAIPASERFAWQPKELVAVFGSHRQRHWGQVMSLAVSKDGKLVATGGEEGLIRFWDPSTNRELSTVRVDPWVCALAFSPDGTRLAYAQPYTIGFLKLGGKTPVHEKLRLQPPASHPHFLAFAANGKRFVCQGQGSDVAIWDLVGQTARHWKTEKSFSESPSHCCCSAVSADGRILAYASEAKVVTVVDITGSGPKMISKPVNQPRGVYSLALSADGTRLAVGEQNPNEVRVWKLDGDEFKEKGTIAFYNAPTVVHFSPDGKKLFLAYTGIEEWHIDGQKPVKANSFAHTSTGCGDLGIAAEGKVLIAGHGSRVYFWDISGTTPVEREPASLPENLQVVHYAWGMPMAFGKNGKHLALFYDGNILRSFEMGGKAPRAQGQAQQRYIASVAPDRKTMLLGKVDGRGDWKCDLDAADPLQGQEWVDANANITFKRLLPRNASLVLGTAQGEIFLVDRDKDKGQTERWRIKGVDGLVARLEVSPDGRMMAAAGASKNAVNVWDISGQKPVPIAGVEQAGPFLHGCIAFSPNNRFMATCAGSVLSLWEIQGSKLKLVFERDRNNDEGGPTWAAFSPDSRTLAIATYNGKLILCDVVRGGAQRSLTVPGAINWVTFSPDGRHLATANSNQTAYILRLTGPDGQPYAPETARTAKP